MGENIKPKQCILIVCEGASEFAYVQVLNQFLRDHRYGFIFSLKNANGGGFTDIRRACRAAKMKKNRVCVMTDRDRYVHNDERCRDCYERECAKLPTFLFQYFNFEDFLLMHFPTETVVAWREYIAFTGHFEKPLRSKDYMQQFLAFARMRSELEGVSSYEKGTMPFEITEERLQTLFNNNQAEEKPYSDFAHFLYEKMKQLPPNL